MIILSFAIPFYVNSSINTAVIYEYYLNLLFSNFSTVSIGHLTVCLMKKSNL